VLYDSATKICFVQPRPAPTFGHWRGGRLIHPRLEWIHQELSHPEVNIARVRVRVKLWQATISCITGQWRRGAFINIKSLHSTAITNRNMHAHSIGNSGNNDLNTSLSGWEGERRGTEAIGMSWGNVG